MAQIYLTGAVTNFDDPFVWHDKLADSDEWGDHEFVNPYTLNEFELGDDAIYEYPEKVVGPAENAVESADGLLVRWEDDVFLVGTAMEIKHAHDHGVPVVLWYEGWKDNLSPWLLDKTRGHFEDRDKAMKVLLGFTDTRFTFSKQ